MKSAKQAMKIDLSEKYKDFNVLELMNRAAFLDPQFKTLAHLPASTVEDITVSIQREMVVLESRGSCTIFFFKPASIGPRQESVGYLCPLMTSVAFLNGSSSLIRSSKSCHS